MTWTEVKTDTGDTSQQRAFINGVIDLLNDLWSLNYIKTPWLRRLHLLSRPIKWPFPNHICINCICMKCTSIKYNVWSIKSHKKHHTIEKKEHYNYHIRFSLMIQEIYKFGKTYLMPTASVSIYQMPHSLIYQNMQK